MEQLNNCPLLSFIVKGVNVPKIHHCDYEPFKVKIIIN